MNTLEMIKDWKESNCKKKYMTKSHGCKSIYTIYNNGVDVLFCSYFHITIGDSIKESKPFTINKDNLEWQWEQITIEYNIEQAFEKTSQGECMVSLVSGNILKLSDSFTKKEILGMWIEKY